MQASATALQWLQLQLSHSHLCGRTSPHQQFMLIQPTNHFVHYCMVQINIFGRTAGGAVPSSLLPVTRFDFAR